MRKALLAAVIAAVTITMLAAWTAAAGAALTIPVNSEADFNLIDNAKACTLGEQCSLRAALETAAAATAVTDTEIVVSLPAGHYALSSEKGPLVIGNATAKSCEGSEAPCPVTLQGAGAGTTRIDGEEKTGLLRTAVGAGLVTIASVTLERGHALAGGAIVAQANASVTVREAVLSKNTAFTGGAINVEKGATVELIGSSLTDNQAEAKEGTKEGEGGAIAVSAGALRIGASTLSGNTAAVRGGAIELAKATEAVTIVDSTLAANGAPSGAAIDGHGSPIALRFSTLAGSTGGAAIRLDKGGPSIVEGLILASNQTNGCTLTGTEMTAAGANIVFAGACTVTGTTPLEVDPKLAALAPSAGLGATRALESASPAINAAGASCPTANVDEAGVRDERGFSRPQGSACDIGAYEAAADAAVTLTPLAESVALDATATLTGSVEDRGEEAIAGAHVSVPLPAGTTLAEAVEGCTAETSGEAEVVTCALGEVKPEESAAFSLPLRFGAAGPVTLTATAAAAGADFEPANDQQTVATTVTAPTKDPETKPPPPVLTTPPVETPAPTEPKGPTSKVSLSRTLFTVDAHSNVTLRVSCTARTAGGCVDSIAIYGSSGKLPASVAASRSTKAKLLARSKIRVNGGQTVTVRLHLSTAAQRLLHGKRSIAARLLVTVQVAAGSTTHAYNVTLKKAVAKHKR
jgi:Domain of unknown function DUF11